MRLSKQVDRILSQRDVFTSIQCAKLANSIFSTNRSCQWTEAGQDWVDNLMDEMERRRREQERKLQNTRDEIAEGGHKERKAQRLQNRLERQERELANMNAEFTQVRAELDELSASTQVYNVVEDESLNAPRVAGSANGTAYGKTVFSTVTGAVDIRIPSLDNQVAIFSHEAKHAHQFEVGATSIKLWTEEGEQNIRSIDGSTLLADWTDEIAAYNRGKWFGGEDVPSTPYAGIQAGAVNYRSYTHNGVQVMTSNNANLIRGTAMAFRMAVRVPINGVRTTIH